MFDLRDIGKSGIIIQYEDIISMIGFNVAKAFRKQGVSDKLDSMSVQDVLLSYINREDEDYSKWLKKEFDILINPDDMLTSFLTMQPNLLYSYKVFTASHDENINTLYIYSNNYSPIVEQATGSYGFPGIQYVHGNIIEFLNEHPNFTYLTSSVDNIKSCENLKAPVCLVICDDYLYISEIFNSKVDEKLKALPNIFLRFTSIISAGIL